MLRINIKDTSALEELQEAYGIKKFTSLLDTLRKVIPKLLGEDDLLEFVLPLDFFSKSYQDNIQAFVQHFRKAYYKIYASRKLASRLVVIRAGWDAPTFGFAKNLTNMLKKKEIYHVDVLLDDMPKAYREQPFHFINRLSKRLGFRIKRIVLGDTMRFCKPPPKSNKKPKHEKH